ncbi:hypothetical protein BGX28_008954 [Mortierella sp. GBA30]|nr:hypothetical protein BGX28_008954 [Mortierella sp. GBA30]
MRFPRSPSILQQQHDLAALPAPLVSPLKDGFSLAPSALSLATSTSSYSHSQTSTPPPNLHLSLDLSLNLALDLGIGEDGNNNGKNNKTKKSTSAKSFTHSTTDPSNHSVITGTDMDTMSASKSPFMVGSLLQQRVEAEKQEIENMKLQLRMREQAGVLGSRTMSEHLLQPNTSPSHYQHGGHGRGLSSAGSTTSISSGNSAYNFLQQQQPQQKFGGPGTLIEKGEARAAQLLERSKSAGNGLLRPSNAVGAGGSSSSSRRTRSKSRGPGEDHQSYYGRPSPPHSPGGTSSMNSPAMPQGPLLHFADENAMIQPGLLLDRARSTKQSSSSQMLRSPGQYTSSGSRVGGNSSHNLLAGQSQGQYGGGNSRTRQKPLIDLGNLNTSHDMIGPGLLTGTTVPSGSQSARSPRRQKPLLDF